MNEESRDDQDHAKIREEMAKLRAELTAALRDFLENKDIKSKLNASERAALKKEFDDLDELLRRLQEGLIHLALFGITSSGKSSIINSLIGEDVAKTGVAYGTTTEKAEYTLKKPWCLVDVPGILDNKVNDKIALEEAHRAIGHIFVIEREPYGPELELFDLIHEKYKESPRIVFVNKWDKQLDQPKEDRDIVKERIVMKMLKYVKDKEKDILFGSAALYDRSTNKMVRQPLPQLEDRLYHDSGTLGEIVNVIDPAHRASSLISSVKQKLLEIRRKVARRINIGFATGAIATSFVPFDSILVAPSLYISQFLALCSVMGSNLSRDNAAKVTWAIIKECIRYMAGEFIVVGAVETVFSFLTPFIGGFLDLTFLSYFKYKRTIIFGEVAIAYIENDFSFGDDIRAMMEKAKARANEQMKFYKKKGTPD